MPRRNSADRSSLVEAVIGCPEPGDRVVHRLWGAGRVSALLVDGKYVGAIVRFDDGVRREVPPGHLTAAGVPV